ncbi:hypothetical protein F5B20DRAFT_575757 [Whalleya microplaca]|nr:hypothetical protein F5B20DRAFT_575757 [Whalleya microplaca]
MSTRGKGWHHVNSQPDETGEKLPTESGQDNRRFLWWWEIALTVLSIASMVTAIVLLAVSDGKPLGDWTSPISLNTIISVLGAISKASFAFAVGSCIAQQKWNWFYRKSDQLITFDRFEEASRGPWGSMRLLRHIHVRHWTTLGPLIIILLLGFEPFLQAVITHVGRNDDRATMSADIGQSLDLDIGILSIDSHWSTMTVDSDPSGDPSDMTVEVPDWVITPDIGIGAAFFTGMYLASQGQRRDVRFTCGTGNCTWPLATSLAICSTCQDISSHLKRKDSYGTPSYSLEEIIVNSTSTSSNTTKPLTLSNPTGVPDSSASFFSSYVTSSNRQTISFRENPKTLIMAKEFIMAGESYAKNESAWEDVTATASECALYFCTRVYQSKVEQNVLTENVLGEWSERVNRSFEPVDVYASIRDYPEERMKKIAEMDAELNNSFPVGNQDFSRTDLQLAIPDDEAARLDLPKGTPLTFNVSQATTAGIVNFFNDKTNIEALDRYWSRPDGYASETVASNRIATASSVNDTLDNLSRVFSTWMRDIALHDTPHTGAAQQWTIYIKITWGYLVFPLFTMLVGLTFCVLSIWQTSSLGLSAWKGSSLASLAHGLDTDGHIAIRDCETVDRLEEKARTIAVKLGDNDGRLELCHTMMPLNNHAP